MRTLVDIPADQALLASYGPHYGRSPTAARQAALQTQYYFTCDCEACSSTGIDYSRCYLCKCGSAVPGSQQPCLQCGRVLTLAEREEYAAILAEAEDEEARGIRAGGVDAITGLKSALRLREQVLHRLHRRVGVSAESIHSTNITIMRILLQYPV